MGKSDAALARFEEAFAKSFGEGTLLVPGCTQQPYEVISTGSVVLDVATGVGGYVEGRLHEIYAPDDGGKTTLAIMACAEAQKKYPEKRVAYIDMEHKFDKVWAAQHGVDLGRIYLYTPHNAEEVADAVGRFCSTPLISMVVVDSVGAMIGKVEQEKTAEEATVAVVAKIVTRMVKNATSQASQNGQVVILINQIRANIAPYGGAVSLPGGMALKHATTMRFKMSGTAKPVLEDVIDGEKLPVGKEVAVLVERNKVGPRGKVAVVTLLTVASKYGPVGIDTADECVTVGLRLGIVKQGGAWYTAPDGSRHQGRDAFLDHLRAHPDVMTEIRRLCLDHEAHTVVVDDLAEGVTVVEEEPPPQPARGRAPRGKK